MQLLGSRQMGSVEVTCFLLDLDHLPLATSANNPDHEVPAWRWVLTQGGVLPQDVLCNLHVPLARNLLVELLGLNMSKAEPAWHTNDELKQQAFDYWVKPDLDRKDAEHRSVPVDQIDAVNFDEFKWGQPAPWNPKQKLDPKGGPKYVQKLANAMKRRVALPPAVGAVVGDRIEMVDGAHRLAAAKRHGLTHVPMWVTTRKDIQKSEQIPKKIRDFRTDEGQFADYDVDPRPTGRAPMFTIQRHPKGYVVRNAMVPEAMQRQGIATRFYQALNQESVQRTGKPLRSTPPRQLQDGRTVHEFTPAATALWDSLARKGVAEKVGDNYVMNSELEKRSNNVKQKTRDITPDQAQSRREIYARSLGLQPKVNAPIMATQQAVFRQGRMASQESKAGNVLGYDKNFGLAHELGLAMHTPVGRRADSRQDKDFDPAEEQRIQTSLETKIDRRAGVDPHKFAPTTRKAKYPVTAMLQQDAAAEGKGYPVNDRQVLVPYFHSSALGGSPTRPTSPAQHKQWQDEAKKVMGAFDKGRSFTSTSRVVDPKDVDAKINARTQKSELVKAEPLARDLLVCIPASRRAQVEQEEADVAKLVAAGQKAPTYWWSVGRLPKVQPHRVYFAWGGSVQAWHDCVGMVDRPNPRLLLDHVIHSIQPAAMKAFRGWRYYSPQSDVRSRMNKAEDRKMASNPEIMVALVKTTPRREVVAIAAHDGRGNLLMAQRQHGRKWTTPAGMVNSGEHHSQAALRELHEETGLKPQGEVEYLGSAVSGRNRELLVHAYRALVPGEPTHSQNPDAETGPWQRVPHPLPEEVRRNLHAPYEHNVLFQKLAGQPLTKNAGDLPVAKTRKVAATTHKVKAAPLAPKKDLVVLHNLSEAGLAHAHKMGGLPAPSIAVAHEDRPLTGFGEVSLVGHPGMVDPKAKVPLFDADVYSPRYPRAKHKIDEKAKKKLNTELQPHLKDVFKVHGRNPSYVHVGDDESFMRDLAEGTPAKDLAQKHHGDSINALRLSYLRSKGQDPQVPMRSVRSDYPFAHKLKDLADKFGTNIDSGSPEHQELSGRTHQAIDEWAAENGEDNHDRQHLSDMYKRTLGLDEGNMHWNKTHRILRDAQDAGKVEPDNYKYDDHLRNKTKDDPNFHQYLHDKVSPLQGDQYIEVGNRKQPHTIDNVLRALIKKPVRGGEGSAFGGTGQTRSLGAKKFSSLDQAKKGSHKLVSHEEMEAAKDQFTDKLSTLAERLRSGNNFGGMDHANNVIADFLKYKSVGRALSENGYKPGEVSPETQDEVRKLAHELVSMPTEYFEAKPQRIVGLNEFRGAAVPHDASPATLSALRHHGVDVEHYQRGDEGDRKRAIQALAGKHDLKLSEAAQLLVASVRLRK